LAINSWTPFPPSLGLERKKREKDKKVIPDPIDGRMPKDGLTAAVWIF
jgi:hypothetical protein